MALELLTVGDSAEMNECEILKKALWLACDRISQGLNPEDKFEFYIQAATKILEQEDEQDKDNL